ncbi:MAG TPA: hypothetical protein VI386_27525 [Candidatus Sulfotelmatobacter sp.]
MTQQQKRPLRPREASEAINDLMRNSPPDDNPNHLLPRMSVRNLDGEKQKPTTDTGQK